MVHDLSSITGYVPSPARPSAPAFKTFVTPLVEPTGASQTQRSEGHHNPSVEMATLTTAEGTRTPPVLQNLLYCQERRLTIYFSPRSWDLCQWSVNGSP